MRRNTRRYINTALLIIFGLTSSLLSAYYVNIINTEKEMYYAVLINGQLIAFFAYLFAFIEISMVFFDFKD
jgi:hypothetical protein